MATPVDVSLWVRAYKSTAGSAAGCGRVPAGDSMTSGSFRCGAAFTAAANLEENSPKERCWLCVSMRPKMAASQNAVVPPLPRSTS